MLNTRAEFNERLTILKNDTQRVPVSSQRNYIHVWVEVENFRTSALNDKRNSLLLEGHSVSNGNCKQALETFEIHKYVSRSRIRTQASQITPLFVTKLLRSDLDEN